MNSKIAVMKMTRIPSKKLSWLKSLIVHGDFNNFSEEFDVFDENEEENSSQNSRNEKKSPPQYPETPTSPKFEDPLLDEAYQLGKEDDILKLMRDTLWEINEFESELDVSLRKLHDTLDKKEYQYDPNNSK